MNVNANLMAENVIMINVEVRIKNEKKTSFVRKNILFGILLHVNVKMVNI